MALQITDVENLPGIIENRFREQYLPRKGDPHKVMKNFDRASLDPMRSSSLCMTEKKHFTIMDGDPAVRAALSQWIALLQSRDQPDGESDSLRRSQE